MFPLSDVSMQKMKRAMPMEHLRQVEEYFTLPGGGLAVKASPHELAKKQRQLMQQQREQTD